MLQYILTGLAGVALGIVGMRIWQMRQQPMADAGDPGEVPEAMATAATSAAPKPNSRNVLIGAGALVAVAITVIALKPDSSETASPNAAAIPGAAPAADKALDDVDTMTQRLADRLEKNPDGEGFRMLGWSYVMTGHPDKAVAAYKRALTFLPNQANVHAGYAEALVGVAKGTVTQEAKDAFDKAIIADPAEPRARYFEALWMAQHGQEKQALDKWIALARSAPADAAWQADLRRQIGETSAKLGVAVPANLAVAPAAQAAPLGAPPALDNGTMQAASALPAADRQAMVDQMVEGLAKKLQANPKDADGWVRLLRSRMVLKQGDQAGRELTTARRALAGSAADLAMVNGAAKEFGVPGS
jgi:cytochrome c-type biogenesis protein CcmH